jgi:adenine-specific DNA methylase
MSKLCKCGAPIEKWMEHCVDCYFKKVKYYVVAFTLEDEYDYSHVINENFIARHSSKKQLDKSLNKLRRGHHVNFGVSISYKKFNTQGEAIKCANEQFGKNYSIRF